MRVNDSFYNSIVEGEKQNKSWWRIDITHRSFQWPRVHGVEFMRTHTHTNTHTHAHAHLSFQVTGRAGFWWILDSCFTLSYQSNYLWHVSQNIHYVHTRSNSHTRLRSGSVCGPTLNSHNPITWYPTLKTAGGPDLKNTKVRAATGQGATMMALARNIISSGQGTRLICTSCHSPKLLIRPSYWYAIDFPVSQHLLWLDATISPRPCEQEGRHRRVCVVFSQTPPLNSSDITVSDASLICKSVGAMQKVIDVVSMATM